MKVLPFKIPKPEKDTLIFQIDHEPLFYDKLHEHEEIQLSYIIEGEGTLVIGDTINDYAKDDVLIIGGNIPHVFKSDPQASDSSHMLTLFFTRESFGKGFFELEELKELEKFFKLSKHGFKVTSNKLQIKLHFLELEKASKLERFISLLELLKIMSKADFKSLSSFVYDKAYSDNEGYRMRNVFEYSLNNYESEITLERIAEVANMSKNAFCRYFKKRTNKTYIRFLNELRIEHACKLISNNKDLSITEIAEMAGFNNTSNFNRQFKSVKRMSPKVYRKGN